MFALHLARPKMRQLFDQLSEIVANNRDAVLSSDSGSELPLVMLIPWMSRDGASDQLPRITRYSFSGDYRPAFTDSIARTVTLSTVSSASRSPGSRATAMAASRMAPTITVAQAGGERPVASLR